MKKKRHPQSRGLPLFFHLHFVIQHPITPEQIVVEHFR